MRQRTAEIISVSLIGIFLMSMIPSVGADYDDGTIIGIFYNTDDQPRIGAEIFAYNIRTAEFISTFTDEYGMFELDLEDLESGFLVGDEIAIVGIQGDVTFWTSLYDVTRMDNYLVINDGVDRIVSPNTPTAYWGSPQYEMGLGDYTEEMGCNWGIIEWESPNGPDIVQAPELVVRTGGKWTVKIDMRFEDDVLDDPEVDDYKIKFIFWVSTIQPTQWQPSPKTAQPPNAVRKDDWDATYRWNDVPYDTNWVTIEVDLNPPNGQVLWYGNAEMISYHWSDLTQEYVFYQHAQFWETHPIWKTVRSILK